MFKFSKRSIERMQGVDDRLVRLMHYALAVSPIDFGIPQYGGLRTPAEQKELFDAGKSKADGTTHKSYHQTGKAIDVYAYINGKASWDNTHLVLIAGVVLSEAKRLGLKVTWGGTFGSKDFNGWDKPHFQLED